MSTFLKRGVAAAVLAIGAFQVLGADAVTAEAPPAAAGKQTFADNCAGCHGADLSGGRAPSLFNPKLLAARTDAALIRTIEEGVASGGMPPFKGVLADSEIQAVVSYLRTAGPAMAAKPAFVPSPDKQIVRSQKQAFRIDVVAAGLETPFGMSFLPDGRLLVTERPGRLRIIKDGKLLPQPVKGTPAVWVRQDAGLLDVAVHPDYARNGWIYLAYTDSDPARTPPQSSTGVTSAPSPPSMTVLVRGKLNARNEWVQQQEIFRAPYSLYTPDGSHYGTRFLFDGKGHVFYSLGDRGDFTNAQKLDNPLGKIHRINDDGSVPSDNPFVETPDAVATIWSYGHRNPQGLAFDPVSGLLWESEHGPAGGDEINIIEKGENYGWGVATMGVQRGITKRTEPGMVDPIVHYTPTIAPSGVKFYTGERYPGWKNSLFVAGLAGQQLRRLEVRGREVLSQEVVFGRLGRTRQTATGPDGLIYVLLQNPTGAGTGFSISDSTPGMVIRLVPVE